MKDFAIYPAKRKGSYTMPKYHYHDYYEVYYLLSGHRYYYIENKRYSIDKGSLLFIGKNEIHKTVDSDHQTPDHERLVLYFSSRFLRRFSNDQLEILLSPFDRDNRKVQFSIRDQSYIERLMFQMHHEFNQQDSFGRELYLESLLVQFLLFSTRKTQTDQPAVPEDSMNARMAEIIAYCNKHFREELGLEELAGQFHISTFYLSRLFKRTTGFTFKEYINTLRIREAEKLLRESNHKIIYISEQVGFASVSHFNRKFKQVTRMAPKEFKKLFDGDRPFREF
ncbi:AraC family transcriptional regulator [Paenibacillus shunpengii]|uniref:AraC family transcriptional regulator n=1 Tax=Paenibacillus shunpengii TaxID=2054424 RepID=A0ABW5SQL5_9BACL|nr:MULTISPECIES: AraC family transcriptional regulator [unclassified Paenibacillus]SDX04230.1 AraC-like ligand binding domain-containing protein [Paenibacillus sp. PDC88]